MTTLTKASIVLGAVALLAAAAIWFAGYQWAGRECIEGGRGADLLNGREGSIQIVGDSCRATTTSGEVRQVPLSEWQWDGPALAAAAVGVVALAAAAAPGWRRPRGLRE
jgi:hypothetical protein